MDLVSVSSEVSYQYKNLYNNLNQKSDSVQDKNDVVQNAIGTSNIILVKKGSTGYMTDVDFDDDGNITLEELNKYCDENGVSEKDKIKLMTTMEFSKVKDRLVDENVKQSESELIGITGTDEKNNQDDEKSIYARKGDEKYNESMDTNKDSVVTYEEYIKYATKQAQNQEKALSKDNNNEYAKSIENDTDVITSTVEYEV